jgi:hypothetical protein
MMGVLIRVIEKNDKRLLKLKDRYCDNVFEKLYEKGFAIINKRYIDDITDILYDNEIEFESEE